MVAMNWSDIDNAATLYRQGVLPLKAVAWAVARFRSQEGAELTAADLIRMAGASKSAAYRAVAELRLMEAGPVLESDPEPIRDSRISGIPLSQKAGKSVPEIGKPPTPPYKETEKTETHIGPDKFPICGNRTYDGVGKAVAVLSENLQTEPLGGYLSRNSHLPEVVALAEDTGRDGRYPAGWRLESAAMKFLSPRIPDDVRSCRDCRSSLNYLLAIARGLTEPYAPPSLAEAGYRPTGTDPAGACRPTRPINPNLPDVDRWYTEDEKAS